MANLKKVDEYKAFKEFLVLIRKGKSPYMVGGDYVVISKEAWERTIKNINEAIMGRKIIERVN